MQIHIKDRLVNRSKRAHFHNRFAVLNIMDYEKGSYIIKQNVNTEAKFARKNYSIPTNIWSGCILVTTFRFKVEEMLGSQQ